jgi:hypothetical protein
MYVSSRRSLFPSLTYERNDCRDNLVGVLDLGKSKFNSLPSGQYNDATHFLSPPLSQREERLGGGVWGVPEYPGD